MTDPPKETPDERTFRYIRRGWIDTRRERVRAQIDRNRRGEYRVPTWVLAVALALVLAACGALLIFG